MSLARPCRFGLHGTCPVLGGTPAGEPTRCTCLCHLPEEPSR